MAYKIFICYRRADIELARTIERQLTEKFGADTVFLDIDSIRGGEEWKKSILKALKDNPIVVTLITTKWNSRRSGHPKLMNVNDHVRFEIETALGQGLPVVPVVYERAYLPKENHLPLAMQPILKFQKISLSQESWKNDSEKLIKAISSLLGEKPKVAPKELGDNANSSISNKLTRAPIFDRSQFTLSTDQQKEFAENQKKREKQRVQAQLESRAFYQMPAFWVAVLFTIALSFGSVYAAEILIELVITSGIPNVAILPGIVLSSIWPIVWLAVGAVAYSYDPDRGSKVFYTRGILGGWVLGYEDFEPIGYWAAFPIATTLLWIVARGLAMLAFAYLQWDYMLVFWIVIGVYTLPVLAWYSLNAFDEVQY